MCGVYASSSYMTCISDVATRRAALCKSYTQARECESLFTEKALIFKSITGGMSGGGGGVAGVGRCTSSADVGRFLSRKEKFRVICHSADCLYAKHQARPVVIKQGLANQSTTLQNSHVFDLSKQLRLAWKILLPWA